MLERLRLRYGLRWAGKYPPIPWREILMTILLVLIYGLVDRVDTLATESEQASRLASHNAAYKDVVIACLNRKGFYYPDTRKAFICEAQEI